MFPGLTKASAESQKDSRWRLSHSARFKISGLFSRVMHYMYTTAPDKVVDYYIPDPKSTVDGKQKLIAVIALKNKKDFPSLSLTFMFSKLIPIPQAMNTFFKRQTG